MFDPSLPLTLSLCSQQLKLQRCKYYQQTKR